MAMELKHLNPQHVMDVTGKAIDEIIRLRAENAELNAENERLKEMMPEYEQFIKDEKFKKKLVDEYAGYVYEWAGHRYVATPYINVFIKGILRALWLARANPASNMLRNPTATAKADTLTSRHSTVTSILSILPDGR